MAKFGYLKWCVEVANADLTSGEVIQSLVEVAADEGFFHPERDQDVIEFWVQEKAPVLQNNIKSLVAAIGGGNKFYVNIEKNSSQQFYFNQKPCFLDKENISGGQVRFLLSDPPIPSQEDRDKQKKFYQKLADKEPHRYSISWVEKMCESWEASLRWVPDLPEYDLDLNDLVYRFYEDLNQYCHDKKSEVKNLPLRICKLDTCSRIFLGRLKRQEFCSKRHGEVWHSKKAYRKKVLGK